MPAFRAIEENAARKPSRTINIPPSAFADDWASKPDADVCVGLRLVSEADTQTARGEAAKKAWALHPEPNDLESRIDAFNDALMAWMVARGTCDPNDIGLGAEIWEGMAEDIVPQALTSAGIRLVFDELEAFQIAESPTREELADEDVGALAEKLVAQIKELADPIAARRVRRLLGFVAAELGV